MACPLPIDSNPKIKASRWKSYYRSSSTTTTTATPTTTTTTKITSTTTKMSTIATTTASTSRGWRCGCCRGCYLGCGTTAIVGFPPRGFYFRIRIYWERTSHSPLLYVLNFPLDEIASLFLVARFLATVFKQEVLESRKTSQASKELVLPLPRVGQVGL